MENMEKLYGGGSTADVTVRKPMAETVKVTKEIAEMYLARKASGKKVNNNKVDRFSKKMKSGIWAKDPKPVIVFDEHGALIDGAATLAAVAKSGFAIEAEVRSVKYEPVSFVRNHEPGVPVTEFTTIDPALARAMLSRNVNNRTIRERRVRELAAIMKEGRWGLSTDEIAFDDEGTLINGQHRLLAVVASGTTIKATVAYGIPQNPYIDLQSRRTLYDNATLSSDGTVEYDKKVFAAIGFLYRVEKNHATEDPVKIRDAYDRNLKTIKSVEKAMRISSKLLSYGMDLHGAAFLMAKSGEFRPNEIVRMVTMFNDGNISDPAKDKPIKLLREQVMAKKGVFERGGTGGAETRMYEYVKTFVPYLRGRKRKLSDEEAKGFVEKSLKAAFVA